MRCVQIFFQLSFVEVGNSVFAQLDFFLCRTVWISMIENCYARISG
jgi:hypothetical protein